MKNYVVRIHTKKKHEITLQNAASNGLKNIIQSNIENCLRF